MVMFLGSVIWNMDSTTTKTVKDAEGKDTTVTVSVYNEDLHHTFMFNTFIMLQIFNEINCRKVGPKEFNVFERFLSNYMYIAIVFGTVIIQIGMIEYFGPFVQCVPMTSELYAASAVFGVGSLVFGAIVKLTPMSWIQKVPTGLIDEDLKLDSSSDPLMSKFNQHMKGKALKKKPQQQEEVDPIE